MSAPVKSVDEIQQNPAINTIKKCGKLLNLASYSLSLNYFYFHCLHQSNGCLNPTALRMAKTPLSFGNSECNRGNIGTLLLLIPSTRLSSVLWNHGIQAFLPRVPIHKPLYNTVHYNSFGYNTVSSWIPKMVISLYNLYIFVWL